MSAESMGLIERLVMAWVLPWQVLFNGRYATQIKALRSPGRALPPGGAVDDAGAVPDAAAAVASLESEVAASAASIATASGEGAIHLLGLLQRDGRLVDFLLEDVSSFSDREIGGAARSLHDGCKKTVQQYFRVEAIRSEDEGAKVTIEPGFDAAAIRLVGDVRGEPPFQGTLAHPGWRVAEVKLPERTGAVDVSVVSPAEIEL